MRGFLFEGDILEAKISIFVSGVFGEFELSDVDGKGSVEEADWLGAFLDSCNGAEDDAFVAGFGTEAGIFWGEAFAWSNEATVGFPGLVEQWRNAAVMHVARNIVVKFGKICGNFWIAQEDRRMDECEFDFALREITAKLGRKMT